MLQPQTSELDSSTLEYFYTLPKDAGFIIEFDPQNFKISSF